MEHTLKIGIKATDRDDSMFDDDVEVIFDDQNGTLRTGDDPPLLAWKAIVAKSDVTAERDYLLNTVREWEVKVEEDSEQIEDIGQLEERTYDFDDVTKLTKGSLVEIEKRFKRSKDKKERRFLKGMEIMVKAFQAMVEGTEKLDDQLGNVDLEFRVELVRTEEGLYAAPQSTPEPVVTTTPRKRTRKK